MARLTRNAVTRILGEDTVEDHVIAEIVATGADEDDLVEAYGFLVRGDEMAADVGRQPHGTVARLYEILSAAAAAPDEDERGPA